MKDTLVQVIVGGAGEAYSPMRSQGTITVLITLHNPY